MNFLNNENYHLLEEKKRIKKANDFFNEINQILIIKMLDKNDENKNLIIIIFFYFLNKKIQKEDISNLIIDNFTNEEIINFSSKYNSENLDDRIQAFEILKNKYKIYKQKKMKNKRKLNEKKYLINTLNEQIKIIDNRLLEVLNEKEEIKIRSLQEGYNGRNDYFIDEPDYLDKKAKELYSHRKFLLEELERLEN